MLSNQEAAETFLSKLMEFKDPISQLERLIDFQCEETLKLHKKDVSNVSLALVDSDRLIRELGGRYDHFVMWGAKHLGGKGRESKWNNHRVCRGDPTYCMGLTHRLMAFADALADLQDDEPPADDRPTSETPA